MANPNVGQLVSQAWQALVTDKPEDNIFAEYSELKRYEEGKQFKRVKGGRSVIGSIEFAQNTTVASMSPTAVLDTAIVDVFDESEAQWKQYGGTFTMTTFEEAVNQGDNAKFDLEKGKLKNLRQSMRDVINEDIFGATSVATDLSGYQSLIPDSPATGTVQGINVATYSFWRSKQASGAQTASAYDNLRSAMRSLRTSVSKGQGSMFPDRWVTGSGTANGYEGLLVANERITDKNDKSANAGFSGDVYYFGNAKVYWDGDCADSRMYAINNDAIKLAYLSGYWFKGHPAVDPANQLLSVFKVETHCQLFATMRRHLGVLTSIS